MNKSVPLFLVIIYGFITSIFLYAAWNAKFIVDLVSFMVMAIIFGLVTLACIKAMFAQPGQRYSSNITTVQINDAIITGLKDDDIVRVDFPDVELSFGVIKQDDGTFITQEIDPHSGKPTRGYVYHSIDVWRFGKSPGEAAAEYIKDKIEERRSKRK